MSDARHLWTNGRVAHFSLKGEVEVERFTEGRRLSVIVPETALMDRDCLRRERSLVFGEVFRSLDDETGFAFGFAERDGYAGNVEALKLTEMPEATHVVTALATHALGEPDIKTKGEPFPLSFGARVSAVGVAGEWTEIATPTGVKWFVPSCHLRPVDLPESDPVAIARRFLNVPYVWGGNSSRGIDCSGLIQAAMLGCGWVCPGDSDLQAAVPGTRIADTDLLEPGDLIFWVGHVAMVTGPDTLIHANAHHMMVVEEPMREAIRRIGETDTGSVTARLRPERRPTVAI